MARPITGADAPSDDASSKSDAALDEAIRVVREGAQAEEKRAAARPSQSTYVPDEFAIEALTETQRLLAYAAGAGITIEPDVSDAIARARAAHERRTWNAEIEAKFWPAKSKLSLAVKPVTVESLAEGAIGAAAQATRRYFLSTVILGAIILPISIIVFINTAVSNDIGSLLRENDIAALALHEQLVTYQSALEQRAAAGRDGGDQAQARANPPGLSQALLSPNLVEKLAQFARINRQIFAESRTLDFFILNAEMEPWWAKMPEDIRRANLELDVQAGDTGHPSVPDVGFQKIATFQDIRSFARQTQQMNLIIYGALTAYVLPIAYSLLGACAFVLRSMAAQSGSKTYQPSYSNRARLIIALIAGTVIGLFNNFTQGVSVSPLAAAFLVGYAVEVFFSFLDAFVHTFDKARNPKVVGASA
jgi:hypothetical protein